MLLASKPFFLSKKKGKVMLQESVGKKEEEKWR